MTASSTTQVVKANGKSEVFDSEKLLGSLVGAGAKPEVAEEIVWHISGELKDGMSTSQIFKHSFFLLEKKNRPVAFRYSLRRAVMELGPSGFPFEDYIGYIMREKGFEVLIGQHILGSCVEHEIDVVAWNENKLIMAEAKFHNEPGLKTDLKVVLYVKARIDDIKKMKYNYGKDRYLDEGWLVTNTKFTSTAIHYGQCQGLTLIGWNYPNKGNLQDLIVDSGLHPLTCLTTLTGAQKKLLLSRKIVLCRTIKQDPSVMLSLGLSKEKSDRVLTEIDSL